MHHYFVENENIEELTNLEFLVVFSEDDKKHIKAQRLRIGEHVTVVDKSGNYFELEITDIRDSDIFAKISKRVSHKEKSWSLTLFQGISKNTKLDEVLRATTEIGIDRFYAVNLARSVAKVKESSLVNKLDRYKNIAKSASMQSGRGTIPHVDILNNEYDFLHKLKDFDLVIVFWEKAEENSFVDSAIKQKMSNCKSLVKQIAVVIGPEGGITEEEIAAISKVSTCSVCTLGDTILRTETAGVVSCALVSFVLGRLL